MLSSKVSVPCSETADAFCGTTNQTSPNLLGYLIHQEFGETREGMSPNMTKDSFISAGPIWRQIMIWAYINNFWLWCRGCLTNSRFQDIYLIHILIKAGIRKLGLSFMGNLRTRGLRLTCSKLRKMIGNWLIRRLSGPFYKIFHQGLKWVDVRGETGDLYPVMDSVLLKSHFDPRGKHSQLVGKMSQD